MKINRENLNIGILSCGYVTLSGIQSIIYDRVLIYDQRSFLIFHVALALCILLAPSYVTLAGTKLSIFTSYTCHLIFFISINHWENSKLLLISSAFLGLGTALAFVAQGKFLVENKKSDAIHKNLINFWFSIATFHFNFNTDIQMKLFHIENVSEFTINAINTFIVIFSFSLFFFIQEKSEYTSGGIECIPSEKFSKSNEQRQQQQQQQQQHQRNRGPIFHLWNPLKNIFLLAISWKMLLIYIITIFTGLLSSAQNNVNDVFPLTLIIGEICGVLFYNICIYKKANSLNITYVGYMILFIFVSISSAVREIQSSEKSEQRAAHNESNEVGTTLLSFLWDNSFIMETFSIGFANVCFHTQIYYLVGILFAKTCTSAFSLVGLFYFFSRLFGQLCYFHSWYHLYSRKALLGFGIFALIAIAIIQYFYVEKISNNANNKVERILKNENSKLKIVKATKVISPEIKMVYDAGFNNNDTEQLSNVKIENTNEKIEGNLKIN